LYSLLACKVPQDKLNELLRGLGGGKIGMDCSIVPLKAKGRDGLNVISTCDFFYPLVDDPFLQVQ
jgi:hypothetical protein